VRRLGLFRPIPEEQLATIQRYRTSQTHQPAGADLYREGERPVDAFTLFEGWVMRYKTLDDGRRIILSFALAGDFLCFQPDLEAPANHSAQAITPVTLCVFPCANLMPMFRSHPELAIQMSWIVARDEAVAHEHLMSVGRRPARERLAHLLLELHYRLLARYPEYGDGPVPLPLTQEILADACGLTTIHVNRTLKALRQDRLLELSHGQLQLLNRQALVSLTRFQTDAFTPRPTL
jgi:CRP-like cAMP-binding protein